MPSLKHTHKYRKVAWGKNKTVVWRCVLPNCGHYLHRDFIVNKKSICWGCSDEFFISVDKLHVAKPKCDDCTGRKQERDVNADIDDFLENF